MPLGDRKNARSCWPKYETVGGYEPLATLGRPARKAGLEAVHRSTIGRANARDTEIMAWAAANKDVVLSQDTEFSAILAAAQGVNPSVVQTSLPIRPAYWGSQDVHRLRRVSTRDLNLDMQREALAKAGFQMVFKGKTSGNRAERPSLT